MKGRRIEAGLNADEVSFTHDDLEQRGWLGDVRVGCGNARLGTDKHREEGGGRGNRRGSDPPGNCSPMGRR